MLVLYKYKFLYTICFNWRSTPRLTGLNCDIPPKTKLLFKSITTRISLTHTQQVNRSRISNKYLPPQRPSSSMLKTPGHKHLSHRTTKRPCSSYIIFSFMNNCNCSYNSNKISNFNTLEHL